MGRGRGTNRILEFYRSKEEKSPLSEKLRWERRQLNFRRGRKAAGIES